MTQTPDAPRRIDQAALLAALVLVPTAYARNRFFDLYRDPAVRGVRARAAQLRGLVRHLHAARHGTVDVAEREADEKGRVTVRYHIAGLNLRRTVMLSPLEVDVVDVALARVRNEPAPGGAGERVQALLVRLADAA